MKFKCSVEIESPIERVVQLFLDQSQRAEWQDGYLRAEPVSGSPGEVGSVTRLFFESKRHKMELLETILAKDLPHEITGKYEHTHMVNTMRSRFTALGPARTRYDAEVHYTRFNGLMPKLMAKLMPGMFRKQTQKWLDQFKALAE